MCAVVVVVKVYLMPVQKMSVGKMSVDKMSFILFHKYFLHQLFLVEKIDWVRPREKVSGYVSSLAYKAENI